MAAKCKVFRALGVKLRVCCSRDQLRNMEVSISIFFPFPLPPFLMFNQSQDFKKIKWSSTMFLKQTVID